MTDEELKLPWMKWGGYPFDGNDWNTSSSDTRSGENARAEFAKTFGGKGFDLDVSYLYVSSSEKTVRMAFSLVEPGRQFQLHLFEQVTFQIVLSRDQARSLAPRGLGQDAVAGASPRDGTVNS